MQDLLQAGIPLRPSDAPVEPEDAPLHLGRARRDLHRRPRSDAAAARGEACNFVGGLAAKGKTVMFVGTKKQAQDAVEEYAAAVGMPYVNHRWLAGCSRT